MARIALIGDYSAQVTAHVAIPKALALEAQARGVAVEGVWVGTDAIGDLRGFDGGWVVPASPYVDMAAVLEAIGYFRASDVPFLGTCGGYQHALVEYARSVLGLAEAGITEIDPECALPVVSGLVCALIDAQDPVVAERGSSLARVVGEKPMQETYRCSFGINPEVQHIFDGSDLRVAARDPDGAVRAMELRGHRFFLGTAFQPERAALRAERHPVVSAFVDAVLG